MRGKIRMLILLLLTLALTLFRVSAQKVSFIKIPQLEKILGNSENKLYVINLWATWCPPCVSELSPGDSYEGMQQFAKSQNFGFQYLYDESQDVAKQFGATNTPHVYVLSKKDGKLIVEYEGAIDNNADNAEEADKKYVEDAVNRLLMGSR